MVVAVNKFTTDTHVELLFLLLLRYGRDFLLLTGSFFEILIHRGLLIVNTDVDPPTKYSIILLHI